MWFHLELNSLIIMLSSGRKLSPILEVVDGLRGSFNLEISDAVVQTENLIRYYISFIVQLQTKYLSLPYYAGSNFLYYFA